MSGKIINFTPEDEALENKTGPIDIQCLEEEYKQDHDIVALEHNIMRLMVKVAEIMIKQAGLNPADFSLDQDYEVDGYTMECHCTFSAEDALWAYTMDVCEFPCPPSEAGKNPQGKLVRTAKDEDRADYFNFDLKRWEPMDYMTRHNMTEAQHGLITGEWRSNADLFAEALYAMGPMDDAAFSKLCKKNTKMCELYNKAIGWLSFVAWFDFDKNDMQFALAPRLANNIMAIITRENGQFIVSPCVWNDCIVSKGGLRDGIGKGGHDFDCLDEAFRTKSAETANTYFVWLTTLAMLHPMSPIVPASNSCALVLDSDSPRLAKIDSSPVTEKEKRQAEKRMREFIDFVDDFYIMRRDMAEEEEDEDEDDILDFNAGDDEDDN